MRKIGSLPDQRQAERFCDYLLTRGVTTVVDVETPPEAGGTTQYHLWIREEDQLPMAAGELQAFVQQPDAPQYQVAGSAAKIRNQRLQEAKRRIRLQRKMPAGSGFGGGPMALQNQPVYFTIAVIAFSIAASLVTEFGAVRSSAAGPSGGAGGLGEQVWRMLTFVNEDDFMATGDPLASVKQGQIWRLITPMFLHGDMPHLAFNMMAMYFLGSVVERIHGIGFMVTITLLCQVVSALAQAMTPQNFGGTPFAIGASGAVVGLFGYLWIRPLIQPSYPVRIPPFFVAITLGWLLMGVIGVLPDIANVAHASGLLMGMLLAPAAVGLQKT